MSDSMEDCSCLELNDLISKIYRVGMDWSSWEEILEYFSSYVENGTGSVTAREKESFEIDKNNFYIIKTWNIDKDAVESYLTKHYKNDVWAKIEWDSPVGKVTVLSDHLPKTQLLTTSFYQNWLKPVGVSDGMVIQLFASRHFRIVLKIFHNDNTDAVLKLCEDLEKLLPHLRLATEIHMKLLGIDSDSEYKNQAIQLKEKYRLTPREIEVAKSSVYLGTNKKIANALGIDESTVKKHIKSILQKMNVSKKDEISHKLICFINPKLELVHPINAKTIE
ncbi:helix-turn-helix transcriptional regulator [Leucothrix arctica]|uniref:HTH luxR-type domain-containing protein n=1 Tax=Leucothrix arctica TaxID=1481894 RepID=A0A317CA88_9GAMM|nr:helix-turn-helix transcriptional regulator [Leucothrix arctica]PWQ95299.1 hypothetical protein DKT75_13220 [Leucothrix arctica]